MSNVQRLVLDKFLSKKAKISDRNLNEEDRIIDLFINQDEVITNKFGQVILFIKEIKNNMIREYGKFGYGNVFHIPALTQHCNTIKNHKFIDSESFFSAKLPNVGYDLTIKKSDKINYNIVGESRVEKWDIVAGRPVIVERLIVNKDPSLFLTDVVNYKYISFDEIIEIDNRLMFLETGLRKDQRVHAAINEMELYAITGATPGKHVEISDMENMSVVIPSKMAKKELFKG